MAETTIEQAGQERALSTSATATELARLKQLVSDLLQEAERQGASAAEAGLSVDRGLSVTARLGEVETIEQHRDQGLGVTVYFGHSKGSASTTDLSTAALRETVSAACRIARYGSEDPYAGLPEPDSLARQIADLDLNHPWDLNAEAAVELALRCEQAALEHHPEISNSEGASVSSHQGLRVLGNSQGFLQGYPSSRHSLSCSVLGQRGEEMQREYWYSMARDSRDLEAAEAVGLKAAERTVRRLGARTLTTRKCPVIYVAEVASGLLRHFIGAIRGGSLYRKSSFLLDCLGQPVFPDWVHIHEQPHLPKALGSAPYDGEGVATQARDLIREGILESYVLDSYSARKLGLKTTGNAGGVHNLTLDTDTSLDLPAMLEAMGQGLLVTELMGQGVNLVTGDYSRGASGFWVENGEIQYPVEAITVAGNLREMFQSLVAVGNDVDRRGNIRTGSIWLEQMTVAGE